MTDDREAVFEKAHAPTDDEREALLRDLYSLRGWTGGDVARRVGIIDRAMDYLCRSEVVRTPTNVERAFTPSVNAVRDVYVGALVEDGSTTEREADAEFSRFVTTLRRTEVPEPSERGRQRRGTTERTTRVTASTTSWSGHWTMHSVASM